MNRRTSVEAESGSEPPPHAAFAHFVHAATRRYVTPTVILSAAAAAALFATLLPLAMSLNGDGETTLQPLLERFLGNAFCRAIVILFLASALYGTLQLIGTVIDRARLRFLGSPDDDAPSSWLALLTGRPLRPHIRGGSRWTERIWDDPHEIADRYSLQRGRYAEMGLLPLRFAVWVLPLLGFIGTVVGIARSIIGLEAVIAPGGGEQSAKGLLTVLGGLQFAFDTTLLGLVAVIPVMLLQMILGGRESAVTEEGRHRVLALLKSTEPTETSGAAAHEVASATSHEGPLVDAQDE